MSKRPLLRFFAGLIAALFLASVMFTGNLLLGALIICAVMLMGMARAGPQQNPAKAHACNQNTCGLNDAALTGQRGPWRWLSLFLSHIAAFFTPNKRAQHFDRYGPGIHSQSQSPTSRASPWQKMLTTAKSYAFKVHRYLRSTYHSVRHTLHQREPLTVGCH